MSNGKFCEARQGPCQLSGCAIGHRCPYTPVGAADGYGTVVVSTAALEADNKRLAAELSEARRLLGEARTELNWLFPEPRQDCSCDDCDQCGGEIGDCPEDCSYRTVPELVKEIDSFLSQGQKS